jgi:hypothetical protein
MILKKLKDFVYIGNIYNVIINGKILFIILKNLRIFNIISTYFM